MATCIASALQNFNSPYRIAVTDETSKRADLYDLSDGASYTVIEDFASWTIALATSMVMMSLIAKLSSDYASPSFSEGVACTARFGAAATLANRFFGFEKDPNLGAYKEKSFLSWRPYGAMFASLMLSEPSLKTIAIFLQVCLPPVMPIMPAIAATANMIKHSNHTSKKVGEIHSKYPLHYQEISQLKPAQKNAIYRAMYSNDLRPPIQVIQHAKTVLGDFNPVKSIFSEPTKKENDNAKWIREGFNKFLNAAYLPSIPSPEEQHEQNLTQRVESLYVHQLQWIVMGLCKLDPIEISDVYFKMLHKRATELTPDKSCDLVEKLKLATSLSHLKTLV